MIRHGRHVYATQFHPEADAESFVVRIGVYRERGPTSRPRTPSG